MTVNNRVIVRQHLLNEFPHIFIDKLNTSILSYYGDGNVDFLVKINMMPIKYKTLFLKNPIYKWRFLSWLNAYTVDNFNLFCTVNFSFD